MGAELLGVLGILVDDVRIAGGLVLLVFAIHDLLFSREHRKQPLTELDSGKATIPIVPLGIPLLVGPATLATTLVVAQLYGRAPAAAALVANGALNWLILAFGERVYARVGHGAMRAVGKVMGLILAALAVAMIRTGIAHAIEVAA